MAADGLWLRGRDLHRRSRPGRGARRRRARRPRCWASSPRTSSSTTCARSSCSDFVFPMFRANALYEGQYLLGTSIARPLIAKRQIEIAREVGADAVAPRRHRQGQRPGALRAHLLCAQARHQGDRAVARMGADLAHQAARVRREAPDPDRQGQARRGAVLGRRQPPALLERGQDPGGSLGGGRRDASISAPSRPRRRPTRRPTSPSISRRATRSPSTA